MYRCSGWLLAIACGVAFASLAVCADESPDLSGELPRIAPLEPALADDSFQVAEGFRLDQVAAEPLVRDPVAMSFDERGRLYVVEMCDYSEQDRDFLGVVRLLEDSDGDGRFDRSSVFADKFSWPTAIICYDGGVFVGAAPDIWYLKDTTGDGRADERRKVLTGFGRSNVQGLMNSFCWGLDNRIHGATSSSGGSIRRADRPESAAVALSGRDFAFDPRTLELTAESGGAQHGLTFDDWGRKFVCSNSDHIQLVMFEDRYIARNRYLSAPGARLSIASDGPQAEVYRISAVEPWRIVRTRLRMSGAVPGIVEGGGRAAGYFTSATGVTIYRGDAWPAEYQGNAFVGDVGSNIVHRKRLEEDGVRLIAHRADDECEFVASRDIWFRPAQFANGPDGNLYIADVYREVIEHPDSLPPVIKKHLDLTSGRDRGRIYRLAPATAQIAYQFDLANAATDELVGLLAHPNAWHRETAARLLYQRQDRAAIPALEALAAESDSALGRMHALYALDGLGALRAEVLSARLSDAHARVREQAVRLCESQLPDHRDLSAQVAGMVHDADARVRYQLAFTLGYLPVQQRVPALAALAARDANDRWMATAIQSSLADGATEMLIALAQIDDGPHNSLLVSNLATQLSSAGDEDQIARLLEAVGSERLSQPAGLTLLQGLAAGASPERLHQLLNDRQLSAISRRIDALVQDAVRVIFDGNQPTAQRIRAMQSLQLARSEEPTLALGNLLDAREPQELQSAALAQLARLTSPGVVEKLLSAWPGLGPTLRRQGVEILLARSDRAPLVLDALADGRLSVRDLDPTRIKQLSSHADARIRERAQQLLAQASPSDRAQVLHDYQAALSLSGDTLAGKALFAKVCATCHKLEGNGHEIGPNLATVQNRGAEAILTNVIDPNREVNPQFVNYLLVTADGRTLTGMIGAETATSITLVRAENQTDTVLRSEIESLESTGASLMPEGLEKDLSPQAMADLIAYLLSVQ